MKHDAFISYSSKDKGTADVVCAALEADGRNCWMAPRDIAPGSDWGEAIIEALSQSRAVVLIFSANANDSPQVRREIQRAFERGVAVVPIRVEDVRPGKALEYYISPLHWLDAMPVENHLAKVVATVRQVLGTAAVGPPGAAAAPAYPPPSLEYATPQTTPTSRNMAIFVAAVVGGLLAISLGGLLFFRASGRPTYTATGTLEIKPAIPLPPPPTPTSPAANAATGVGAGDQ